MTHARPQQGFTLTEILIAIALSASLMLLFDRILVGGYQYINVLMSGQTRELRFVRTREIIANDIHDISVSDRGAQIISATPERFEFYADIEGDAMTERLRVWREGYSIFRSVTKAFGTPPQYDESQTTQITLTADASSDAPLFSYYDATGGDLGRTPDLARIRRVDILFSDTTPTELDRITIPLP